MKKLFTLFVAVMASIGTMVAEVYSGTCGSHLNWELDTETGLLNITGYGPSSSCSRESDQPWNEYRRYIKSISLPEGMTIIGSRIFADLDFKSLSIPSTVTSINMYAFYDCDSIQSVIIPEGVTAIGIGAFYDCYSLSSVTFPKSSLLTINRSAFSGCNLKSIEVPSSVTTIGENAFDMVTHVAYSGTAEGSPWGARSVNGYLEGSLIYEDENKTRLMACYEDIEGEVILPQSLTTIDDYAFYHCQLLSAVSIPDGVTVIGDYVFAGCFELASITIPTTLTKIGNHAFQSCKMSSFDIPDNVTTIGEEAFEYCRQLSSITIGEKVSSIGKKAFSECDKLQSCTFPASVTSIGESCFSGDESLKSLFFECAPTYVGYGLTDHSLHFCEVHVKDLETWCKIKFYGPGYNPLYAAHHLYVNGKEITELIIPEGVTEIGDYAFCGASYMTSVSFPESLTSIGRNVFEYCDALTEYKSPETNQYFSTIDGVLFNKDLSHLILYPISKNDTSYIIPNSVTSIDGYSFQNCKGLKFITIPANVTSIGDWAFDACDGLDSIVCWAATPPTCAEKYDSFRDVKKSIPVCVLANSVGDYTSKTVWKNFSNIQPIHADVVEEAITQAEPTDNSVVIEWPKNDEAAIYTVIIKKGNDTICTLEFDEQGQMLSIAYAAPARDGRSQQPRMATQTTTGWQYTINGLEANTEYEYIVIAKRSDSTEAYKETIPFTTAQTPTALDQTSQDPRVKSQKLIRDGQILILRGDKTFTLQGQEVK